MTLKERLNADFKEAMKNKEKVRKDTISFVRAAIKQFEVDNREEIDDAGIASILAKQVKMRKDALADFESAGRTDLIEAYNAEIQKTAADLGIEKGSGKASMGKLMGATMPKVKGVADGNNVKAAVERFLG